MRGVLGLVAAGVVACGCGSSEQSEHAAVNCPNCPASTVYELDSCTDAESRANAAGQLQLALDLEQSIHELIACGGLTMQVSASLIEGLVTMVVDPEGVLLPSGLTYQGEGVYTASGSSSGSMRMEVRLFEELDGKTTLIEEDLFDRESYLVGAETQLDAAGDVDFDISDPLGTELDVDAKLSVSFEAIGPWFKLTGLANPPKNPLVISVDMLSKLKPKLGNLRVQSEIEVLDERKNSVISYRVRTPAVSLEDSFASGRLEFEMLELSGENEKLGQELTVDDWQIEFGSGNQLSGTVDFAVAGDMAHAGTLSYADSAYADISFRCD